MAFLLALLVSCWPIAGRAEVAPGFEPLQLLPPDGTSASDPSDQPRASLPEGGQVTPGGISPGTVGARLFGRGATGNTPENNESGFRSWFLDRLTGQERSESGPLPASDFPALAPNVPVFSQRAVDALHECLTRNGELLPLSFPGGQYYAFNCLNTVDCLDYERSALTRLPSGRIMRIDRYVFLADRLQDVEIFRLPDYSAAVFVTDTFVRRLRQNGLTGNCRWFGIASSVNKAPSAARRRELCVLVGHVGFEPTTPRLKGGCSATELMARQVQTPGLSGGLATGWGGRTRTYESGSQSPVPYQLGYAPRCGLTDRNRTGDLQSHNLAL